MEYQSAIRSQVEQVLLRVVKPARYVGGELNMIKKDPGQQNIKVCLAFPDIYDIGQSYIGFYILYNILNKRRATLCERTFAPWTDMEELMRGENIPLWSLESFLPVSSFDVVGFTLQYELHYTTVLNMLDLAGIPLKAAERGKTDPLVFGGGPCCINPEPVAEFFDAFLLGDGEEAFPEMLDVIERSRASGHSRRQTLNDLTTVGGVYVPSRYKPRFGKDGSFAGMKSTDGGQLPVTARFVERLKPDYYPDRPLVPLCEIVHDRLAVELMRGCTRGCRFCSAGMSYRPKRERPVQEVVDQVVTNIGNTGWEDVSLVSLSTSDYSGLEELVAKIGDALGDRMVTVSLSSLRADNFSIAMADAVAGGKKSSLTFAPEAGTQRLRNVINKNLTEEQLFETLKNALGGGWNGFKLYFMMGLPTETEEDIIAIADLLNRIHALLRHYKGQRVNVTLSSFSPKPLTPFQWEPQNSVEELARKIRLVKRHLRARLINLKTDDPLVSMLECRLSRGGRELSAVILDAWKQGARLDGWSEQFRADIWTVAFGKAGIALENGGGWIEPGSQLPWSHLSFGISESFLLAERGKAIRGENTPDCGDKCQGCGPYAPFCAEAKKATVPVPVRMEAPGATQERERQFGRKKRVIITRSTTPYLSDLRFRIKFAKRSTVRFTSHLDLVRLFDRTMRRAGIPVAYSQGFHPHPKISFGPPLPVGMKSLAEYADFTLRKSFPAVEAALRKELADGFDLIVIRSIPEKVESLSSIITQAEYYVPAQIDDTLLERVKGILDRIDIPVERTTKKGQKIVDIRPGILDISTAPDDSGLMLLLSFGVDKTVKPSEVLELLFDNAIPDGVTRTEQYADINGTRVTPLDILR